MHVEQSRTIERVLAGTPAQDGAAMRVTRVFARPEEQRRLDPFLLLDHFGGPDPKDYVAGFPDHPHRGFEVLTLMLQGRMCYQDSKGNAGKLAPGGVQWMTAGRGVVHSEIPQQTQGTLQGLELWLNLPASQKMTAPQCRDFRSIQIPSYTTRTGVRVRVVAGTSGYVQGVCHNNVTQPLCLDIWLPPGMSFAQTIAPQANAFVYVYQQGIEVMGCNVPERSLAILNTAPQCDGVMLRAPEGNSGDARLILAAGVPLHEPIVQYGPFVMNTRAEIIRAVHDYQNGKMD